MKFSSIAVIAAMAPVASGFAPFQRQFSSPQTGLRAVEYDLDLGFDEPPKKAAKKVAPPPAPEPVPEPEPAPKAKKRSAKKEVAPTPAPAPEAPKAKAKAKAKKVVEPKPAPAPAPAPRNLMWQAFEALQQKRHADHAYFRDSIKRQKRLIDSSS